MSGSLAQVVQEHERHIVRICRSGCVWVWLVLWRLALSQVGSICVSYVLHICIYDRLWIQLATCSFVLARLALHAVGNVCVCWSYGLRMHWASWRLLLIQIGTLHYWSLFQITHHVFVACLLWSPLEPLVFQWAFVWTCKKRNHVDSSVFWHLFLVVTSLYCGQVLLSRKCTRLLFWCCDYAFGTLSMCVCLIDFELDWLREA